MEIRFTKGSGKYDEMRVTRHGASETIACPKQRIIPHDMVHFAVEATLQNEAFCPAFGRASRPTFKWPQSQRAMVLSAL